MVAPVLSEKWLGQLAKPVSPGYLVVNLDPVIRHRWFSWARFNGFAIG